MSKVPVIPPDELSRLQAELEERYDDGEWEETNVNGLTEMDCLKLEMALAVAVEP